MTTGKDSVSLRRMLELELELDCLRREQGIPVNTPLWVKVCDWLVQHTHEPQKVSRQKYLVLALSCGWFCGAHQFYSGHKLRGILYLLFCWTCVPLSMTFVDIFIAMVSCRPDEQGMIELL